MVIGVDCDEIIFPFLVNHCIFLNDKYHINLDSNNFHSYDFWKEYNWTREEAMRDLDEFTSTPEFMRIQPIPQSREGIRELKRLDDLFIITSRPEDLRVKTEEWLNTYFNGLFSKLVFGDPSSTCHLKHISKRQRCKENNVRLHLEDNYDYAIDISQDIPVLLFNKPWNSYDSTNHARNITRVNSWEEAVNVAKKIYTL